MTKRKTAEMPRHRRSADEARQRILDAAERRLRETGPGSIRLQEVASDVGISHPAVLHHFGSREGLVRAVVERALERLQADLVADLAAAAEGRPLDGAALFERVFETFEERGHGRLVAWLLLSGYDPFDSDLAREGWAKIAETTHALRVRRRAGGEKPSYKDTRFTIVLSALALFGEAIAGDSTFGMAGFEANARTGRTFRKWFATLLARHLDGEDEPR
ncbi:TetR/AcrR family transcriptional regulator [Pendulispora albinea]|uniref:TetR/AcrR family transcriptional regulator n=1 Tax=Pendulispora albinea TaxID=2741071 RepID=A0ABZ2M6L3_9BACT